VRTGAGRVIATLGALSPVLAGLAIGWWLRRAGVAGAADGRFLLLLNLYVFMPALVLRSLPEVSLTREIAVFPLAAVVMVAAGYVVGRAWGRRLPQGQGAVVVMAFMVVNVAFALPFVDAVYGAAGVARLAAFDAVNNVLVLTVVHALAARANPDRRSAASPLRQVLAMPPLYATLVGIGLSLTGTPLPGSVATVTAPFAAASPVLIAVGTGILFQPSRQLLGGAGRLAAGRIAAGLVVAGLLVVALGLDGVDAGVLLLLGVAPLGFVTVTFAAKQDLDAELATQALAVSIIVSVALSLALVLL
jgi:predicted permease